jgi:hypothetical protein
MRFVLNFIFFGLLFYALFLFFPDVFKQLVHWAAVVVDYIQHLFHELTRSGGPTTPTTTP